MKNVAWMAGGVCLLAAVAARAAHPGFVDLKSLDDGAKQSPTFAVTLNDWMLEFGREAMEDDPELAALRGLEAVSVRIYQSTSEGVRLAADELSEELVGRGWMPVVQVNDGDRVRVLIKSGKEEIAGVTVLVASRTGESVFVNAYGSIRSEDLGRLLSGFGDLQGLDGLELALDR